MISLVVADGPPDYDNAQNTHRWVDRLTGQAWVFNPGSGTRWDKSGPAGVPIPALVLSDALPDTTGADLATLEGEVNKIKAVLRGAFLVAYDVAGVAASAWGWSTDAAGERGPWGVGATAFGWTTEGSGVVIHGQGATAFGWLTAGSGGV